MSKLIYSIRALVGIAGQLHAERTKAFSWQKKDIGRSVATFTTSTTSAPSSTMGTLTPKTEPFGPGAGTVNLSELFSAPGPSTTQSISTSTSPALQSPSSILPGTSFSSFSDKVLHSTLYKPSTLITKGGCGGYNVGTCLGAREVAVFMSPHNKIFDYLELLKREMEFLANIFRVMTDYPRHLREREPIEYRSLALSISQVAVRDLGLPVQAQGKKEMAGAQVFSNPRES
ncbi:hypothetical protein EDD21DRAFT_704 [Dissophora ornata]|nr:hypothetical protein EDD21DRAFT_704 [Dissophora ornata]